jgi:hypothetical protein
MKTTAVILALAVLVLAVALGMLCLHTHRVGEVRGVAGPRPLNPCGQGHDRPNPVVCIDANFTKVTPELVHARSNEWIDFYIAGSSGDLDVQFTAVTPVHHAHHQGAQETHHFMIQAKQVTQSSGPIKYRLIDRESGKEIDPEVMIDP